MSAGSKSGRFGLSFLLSFSLVAPATVTRAATTGTSSATLSVADSGCASLLDLATATSMAGTATTVSGKVTNASGAGVAGAMVIAMDTATGQFLGCKDTDASGNYSSLGASTATRVIVAPPKGSTAATLAGSTQMVNVTAGTNGTANFQLGTADLAIGFSYNTGSASPTPIDRHITIACLVDFTSKTSEPYACGLGRDHSSTSTPSYDVRLSSSSVPTDKKDNIGIAGFGTILTSTGKKNLETKFTFDERPSTTTRLDYIKTNYATSLFGTANQKRLELKEAGSGGGGGGGGGGGMPNTNCAPGQTPFITGTLKTPTNTAGAYYMLRLRAIYTYTENIDGKDTTLKSFIPGWGDDSNYFVGSNDKGEFSLCRSSSNGSSTMGTDGNNGDNQGGDGFQLPQGATVKFLAIINPSVPPGTRTVATSLLEVGDTGSSTTYRDCIIGPSATCTLTLSTLAPRLTGFVKTPANVAIPGARIGIYENYGTAQMPEYSMNTLADLNTASDGWFGIAMNAGAGTLFKLKAQSPYCMAEPCPYKGLSAVDTTFTGGSSATWSGGGTDKTINLPQANFVGKLTDPDGGAIGFQPLDITCESGGCTTVSTTTDWSDGSFAVTLADGTYSLTVYPQMGGIIQTTFSIVVSAGKVTRVQRTAPGNATDICGGTATACGASISLQTAAPNFSMLVQTSDGTPVKNANVEVREYVPSEVSYPWEYRAWAQTATDDPKMGRLGTPGVAGVNLEADKVYKVRLDPPWNGGSEATTTEIYIKTANGSGGSLIAYRCAKWQQSPEAGAPCQKGFVSGSTPGAADLLSTVSDNKGGVRNILVMKTANFAGTACRPGSSDTCTIVAGAYVEMSKLNSSSYSDPYGNTFKNSYWEYISGSSTNQTGGFALAFDETGSYKLALNPAWNPVTRSQDTDLTRTEIFVYAEVDSDGGAVVYPADRSGAKRTGASAITKVNGRYRLYYATPSLLGLVTDPNGGSGGNNTNVEVFEPSSSANCTGCRQWFTNAQTDNQGRFSINLPEGKYVLRVNPSWNSDGLTAREVSIRMQDCNSDQTLELYAGDAANCGTIPAPTPLSLTSGRYVVALKGANFAGTLYNPLTSPPATIAWTGYNVEKWNDTWKNWEWQNNFGNTNQSGRFGVNFDAAGKYRVSFSTPWNLRGQLSDARVVLNVAASGSDFAVTPDVQASGGSNVVAADGVTGKWNVSFARPNVSGVVRSPDGSSVVGNSWINVQKWYEAGEGNCWNTGCWQWSPEVSGTSSDNTGGTYALNMPAGHWRLQVNPPWNQIDYTKVEIDILVDAAGAVCRAAVAVSVCPDADKILPGQFDIRLGSPNVRGYVVTESFTPDPTDGGPPAGWTGERSRWSQVRFEKWNGDYDNWQWANIWGQTNNNGYFSQNISENGVYRLTFDPSWQLSDYSSVTKYLAVCDNGAKVQYISENQADTWDCSSPMGSSINESIVLRGANVKGIVRYEGQPLGDVWVSVMSCTANAYGGEWCNWEKGINTPRADWNPTGAGKFAVRIDNETDSPEKYRFEFNPPWNSTVGLVRQQIDVWFADFDPSTQGTEYCFAADYTPDAGDPTKGSCSLPRGEAQTWTLNMTSGNMAGKVVPPTADCSVESSCTGVAGAWLQVEKWDSMPWNTSMYGWMWQPTWANSTGNMNAEDVTSGNFGLNIDKAGLYRVTVNPSWSNPNSYARAVYVVNVASDGKWCVNEGVASNSFDPNQASPTPASCTPTGTDNDPTDTVTGFTARLVGSNLAGVLYDSTASLPDDKADDTKKVSDSWMSLQKEVESKWCWGSQPDQCYTWKYWQWISGSNVSSAAGSKGKFGFSVAEPGNYRIEVYPAWNNPKANTQFRADFTVAKTGGCVDGNSDPTLCAIPDTVGDAVKDGSRYLIKYPAPNFAGTLYDKNGSAPSSGDPVKVGGAWISIIDATTYQWVGGTSTTWNGPKKGDFAMRLADGSYRVEIYPPWDQPDSGMRRVLRVTVSGGDVTQILNGLTGTSAFCDNAVAGSECGSSLDLALLGANVAGHVYYPGASDTANDAYAAANNVGTQTVMPWAWAQALKCTSGTWDTPSSLNCWEWANWANSEHDGTIKFGFESDGIYRIQVWPNYGYFQSGFVEADVTIENGVMTKWRYRGENVDQPLDYGFTPDFGHRKPNVTVTVAGVDASRYVQVSSCTDAGCASPTVLQRLSSVYSGGAWKVSLNLEPGFYKIGVVRKSTDASDPTKLSEIVEITSSVTDTSPMNIGLDLTSLGTP